MAKERRCFKCVELGHMMQESKMVKGCTVEGCPDPRHHTLLHGYKESTKESNKEVVCSAKESYQLVMSQRPSYFMTFPVRVRCGNREVQTYAMLDTGSQRTFCEACMFSEKVASCWALAIFAHVHSFFRIDS